MDELALFRVCFPEDWVKNALLPASNAEIVDPTMDLLEFYIWLGCQFFMACFEGISDRTMWWLTKLVTIEEGAPFRLQKYMPLR